MVEESFRYIKNFIRDPRVASVTPTSNHATQVLFRDVDCSLCNNIVEYGPGSGVITREILRQMRPDARLIVIEINESFYHELKKHKDPRLIVELGSAEQVDDIVAKHGMSTPDLIVSGIPFSLIKPAQRENIMMSTRRIMHPEGSFLVYQASTQIKPLLTDHFETVDTTFVFRNIPPLFILRAQGPLQVQSVVT